MTKEKSLAQVMRLPFNSKRILNRKNMQGTKKIYMLSCLGRLKRCTVIASVTISSKLAQNPREFSKTEKLICLFAIKLPSQKNIGAKNKPFLV